MLFVTRCRKTLINAEADRLLARKQQRHCRRAVAIETISSSSSSSWQSGNASLISVTRTWRMQAAGYVYCRPVLDVLLMNGSPVLISTRQFTVGFVIVLCASCAVAADVYAERLRTTSRADRIRTRCRVSKTFLLRSTVNCCVAIKDTTSDILDMSNHLLGRPER